MSKQSESGRGMVCRSWRTRPIVAGLIIALGAVGAAWAGNGERHEFVEIPGVQEFTGSMIVRPHPEHVIGADAYRAAVALLEPNFKSRIPQTDQYVVWVPESMDENSYADLLMDTGWFRYAHPNFRVYPVTEPDDPRFDDQWHHPVIGSAAAWDVWTGSDEIIVGLIDTGVEVSHPDIAANRVPGYNAVDEIAEVDGGKVDDLHSASHGTHTTGIAAAIGNNGTGLVGVGWNFKTMMVRVSNDSGGGSTFEILYRGAIWAADNGAKSISCSYSGVSNNGCQDTGEYIRSVGALYFYAAGNEGANLSNFDWKDVIVVGATDQNDKRASFSSFGKAVDVFAPGVDILSTIKNKSYGTLSGTSMATPMANGLAALIWSYDMDKTADEIEEILETTCKDLGDKGNDDTWGWGRIDAAAAMLKAEELAGLKFSYPDGIPWFVDPDGGTRLRFDVLASKNDSPKPGTGRFYVDTGDGFVEGRIDVVGDNSYEAVFPESPCDILVGFYVTAEGESGDVYVHPAGAPKNFRTAKVYNETGVAYADHFESNNGFLTSKDNKVNSGLWERGVPVGDKSWPHAPAADADGSGSCWLTENAPGNADIDGGAVYLQSGALDMSQLVNLRYSYWFEEVSDSDNSDYLAIQISQTGEKNTWSELARHETSNGRKWLTNTVSRAAIEAAGIKLGSAIYVRFVAADKGGGNIVEAGIDDLQIDGPVCNPHGPKTLRGDMDCDGGVNFNDVDPFVLALTGQDGYESQFPDCNFENGDINQDGSVDFADIDPFVDCLASGGCE